MNKKEWIIYIVISLLISTLALIIPIYLTIIAYFGNYGALITLICWLSYILGVMIGCFIYVWIIELKRKKEKRAEDIIKEMEK